MCGIGAISTREPRANLQALALSMAHKQRHRGPDLQAAHESPDHRVALAHARLSIVDLSPSGNQPMCNETGELWVVCNGELYDYRERVPFLEAHGHRLRSHSDSELLLHLYEEYGTALFDHLHGMYAFVLYDQRKDLLLCARDRVGKKPLVYAEGNFGVAIASEIPALEVVEGVDWSIDPVGLGLYLLRNVRHVPDPWTFYRGIKKLPPGHAMIVRQGRVERLWRYHHPHYRYRDVSAEELLETFDRAVALRRVADVEVGALLSGGVDSTAIVDAMVRQGDRSIRTYALGRDAQDEELQRARAAATRLGTRHKEFYFDASRQHSYFKHLLELHGEPIMLLPLGFAYELFQHARNDGLRVLMTGHGADELFYGYGGNNRQLLLSVLLPFVPDAARYGLAALVPYTKHGSGLRQALLAASAPRGERKMALYREEVHALWRELFVDPEAMERSLEAALPQWLGLWFQDESPYYYLDESNVIGLLHENAHSVTIAGDLPAMAASVEVRCPFLDQRLVQLAWQVPFWKKVRNPLRPEQNKWLLKQALRGRVPEEVLFAKKRGFGYHIQEADVLRGPWKSHVDQAFASYGTLGGHVRPEAARAWKDRFEQGMGGTAMQVAKLYAASFFETRDSFRTGSDGCVVL